MPEFTTIQKEAEFWDTHSFEEFADELELVTDVRFVPAQPRRAITVCLGADELTWLKERARENNASVSTLVRWWILDQMQADKSAWRAFIHRKQQPGAAPLLEPAESPSRS